MEQTQAFIYSADLINATLQYLATKPYGEVANLIAGFNKPLDPSTIQQPAEAPVES
jgi:hypothetical protein